MIIKNEKIFEVSQNVEAGMKKSVISLVLGVVLFPLVISAQDLYWYKGNTHCHTSNSDGDESPHKVAQWYKEHGYHFLVITDHDLLTVVDSLDSDFKDNFLLIPGEEISDFCEGVPIHLNALNISEAIAPQHGEKKVETLQRNIDAIVQAGGVATINHPHWRWAFGDSEMSQLTNVKLFELYNFSYNCNNFRAGGCPGMEEVWDRMLSKGVVMYGIATDDAHDYRGEFGSKKSNPGTGWIMVRASQLTPHTILTSLEKGDFYATAGVLLKDIQITARDYRVEIQEEDDMKYTTQFIGRNGQILEEIYGTKATYAFKGVEVYVRAKVFASSGEFACTQPVFLNKEKSR